MPTFTEIGNIVPSRPLILIEIIFVKMYQIRIEFNFAYLLSASSATNKTTKFMEPPAVNPDKKLPKHTSVALVENIFNVHANYLRIY